MMALFHEKIVTFAAITTYIPMKSSILIFLLVSTIIFAQEKHHFHEYFSIHEMILGEWELEKTILSDRDSVHYELLPTSKKSLRIDEKSITVFRDSVKYKRLTENFYYYLSCNVETKSCLVFLYDEEIKKKDKKQRPRASYVIEKCDCNHLMFSHIKTSPLAENDFDNYVQFVYKRKQTNKFGIDDLAGSWHFFSDSLKLNLNKLGDVIVLKKDIDTSQAGQFEYHHEIHFQSNILKNRLVFMSETNLLEVKNHASEFVSWGTVLDGVYLKYDNYSGLGQPKDNFWIDFKNQLIYFLYNTISVYHFDFDDEGALILTWDMERTKNLKKIER